MSIEASGPSGGAVVVPPLLPAIYEPVLRRGLAEDLGRAGDLTSDALVPPDHASTGHLVARAEGRCCGVEIAAAAFRLLDPSAVSRILVADGRDVAPGTVLARVSGATRPLLGAERVALNLLGRLCGIATATRDLVRAVAGTGARVVCTRKTTPGLRALEKHAVRAGGGANHRFGLDDAVLVKDNHLAVAGSIGSAVRRAREAVGHWVHVAVEVDSLDQLAAALDAGADAVLLDNMSLADLTTAVARCRGRALTEASGGITPGSIAAVAATGVDLISVGWLTHSAPALDVGFDLQAGGPGA
ncbi:MAG: carboxylating nicotinate-nucleotide diphosphorylase [Acidobacteriota bacterium]|nr:carboxylating nicotinate-nucleotide diphosphorylase [Acidobacteriota bacterium]